MRLLHGNVTANPTAEWTMQQLREAIPSDHTYRLGGGRGVRVGDVHWGDLRPAVMLQDDAYAGDLPVVLVVPLTTARAAMRFAGTTRIHPTAENGLRQASV